MESPLDILSRAAGMVSRNNDSGSGMVVSSSGSNSNGNGHGGDEGSVSNVDQIIAADNHPQCRILKLALVSSNASNSMSNNSSSQNQHGNGTSSKDSTGLGSRGGRILLQDYNNLDSSSPPPVGSRTVAVGLVENRLERQREHHDNMLSSSDSDTPIDMSMKKAKRKITTSDSNDEASSDERDRDEKIKRKRPSVISFASHQRMMSNNVTGFDVDDHFKKSLGLEFYNSVFSDKKKSPTSPPSRSPVPTTTTPDEVPAEDKKKLFKPKIMASHAKVIKSVNHAPDLDNSVDDHFAKALGKSTWMRLQQGL